MCIWVYWYLLKNKKERDGQRERERKYRSDTFSSEILHYGLHNSYMNKEPPPLTTKSG